MSKKAVESLHMKPSEISAAFDKMISVNLRNARLGRKRRGLFVWGPPGVGKSEIAAQAAQRHGMDFIDIRLSQMAPEDLRGIPVPSVDQNGNTVCVFAPIGQLPRDPDARAVIMLDELPNAAPAVQAAAYQLVLDGALGEYVVPKNCVVFAAGNRQTDKGATYQMPTPLMNRFDHVEIKPDFKDWQQHALTVDMQADVIGYLTAFEGELFEFNPSSASRGFATPRSWEGVSDILLDDTPVSDHVLTCLVAGQVGDGIAVKFLKYRKDTMRLPTADDILDGKVTQMDGGKQADVSLMYSLTINLCQKLKKRFEEVKDLPKTDPLRVKFTTYMDNFLGFMLTNFKPELIIMGARTALGLFKITFDPRNMKNWTVFSRDYSDLVLKA